MPLAINFAAARAASLGLAQVADGLRDRFALLTTGRRMALPRHQTLRAVLDWSYALLPDAECLLFHRLAIFSGGFSFEAACAVMREHSPADVAGSIASLVEKSVVNLEQATSGGRWRLLETVRSYAMDKLTSAGDYVPTARRHGAPRWIKVTNMSRRSHYSSDALKHQAPALTDGTRPGRFDG